MSNLRAEAPPILYVVDDDPALCGAVAELLRGLDFEVRPFHCAEEFLAGVEPSRPGCVVLDVRLPGMDGLELQQRMLQGDIPLPVIVLTAYAETSLTVRSLQSGAITVLEKPFRREELVSAIREGVQLSRQQRRRQRYHESLEKRLRLLSEGDRTVLRLMLQGHKNRAIAQRLQVSLRTVENRRRRIFTVMQAASLAELTRMIVEYEYRLLPQEDPHESWLSLSHERVKT
jgi:FixJ family two-component response regulator